MYLIDKETTFKFSIKKGDVKAGELPYIPIQIKDETEIQEGQLVFEAKAYTTSDIVLFNSKTPLEQYYFIKKRTTCNKSLDYMIPSILQSVNYMVMGLSVATEEDEKVFM